MIEGMLVYEGFLFLWLDRENRAKEVGSRLLISPELHPVVTSLSSISLFIFNLSWIIPTTTSQHMTLKQMTHLWATSPLSLRSFYCSTR